MVSAIFKALYQNKQKNQQTAMVTISQMLEIWEEKVGFSYWLMKNRDVPWKVILHRNYIQWVLLQGGKSIFLNLILRNINISRSQRMLIKVCWIKNTVVVLLYLEEDGNVWDKSNSTRIISNPNIIFPTGRLAFLNFSLQFFIMKMGYYIVV